LHSRNQQIFTAIEAVLSRDHDGVAVSFKGVRCARVFLNGNPIQAVSEDEHICGSLKIIAVIGHRGITESDTFVFNFNESDPVFPCSRVPAFPVFPGNTAIRRDL